MHAPCFLDLEGEGFVLRALVILTSDLPAFECWDQNAHSTTAQPFVKRRPALPNLLAVHPLIVDDS